MNIKLHKKFLLVLVKALVVVLTLFLLYQAIFTAPDTFLSWGDILRKALQSPLRALFILTAVLIPVNWGFEARKWQLLGQKLEPISYWRAYRAVMVGLTLGFITPNRLGDYAGRVLELKSRQRLEAIGAIFIGRFCQLVATVLAGSVGLLYFILAFGWQAYPGVSLSVFILLLALCIAMLLLLYNAKAMVAVVAAIKPLRAFVPYLSSMGAYTSVEMTRLLWLSLGRYAVFLGQFILLLILFEVRLSPLQYLSGVSGAFFLKSVVPSVSLLSDLGVRELSAMYLFGLLGQERLQVLSASLSLWLLNIAVPSVVGLAFVLRLRLKKKGVAA
ncbi:lysylphosphatidylglycerol synthase domain-containing protein [Pontibacter anaerobius]|uniref:Lysylphosphatidylglycerol synthase domain-containing protein n=1 Tax=Pontibacter anaerobius TaxID=2993940 RepID=A0ABT3RG24_9BACT|nr:lysylphosphatidylglycerol synthase domain-containing protein [Pontibacter anaerobius]MCX2740792.1 lysylphosphatidylglycerol synthase domain-containing protein [Pontibacter anaerobius]